MIKKSVGIVFSLIFAICFIHNPVSATESLHTIDEGDDSIAVLEEKDDWVEEEVNEGFSPFVVFTLSNSSLSKNKYIKSDYAFNMKKGEKVSIKSLTWSPSSQKVQLGFINADNGKRYWTNNYSGGSKFGGTFSLGGPDGRYYIAIRTASTNTASVNVRGQFEF